MSHMEQFLSKISCNSVLSGRTGQSATESIPRAIGDPTYGILLLFTQYGGSNPYPTHPGQEYDSLYYILILCI